VERSFVGSTLIVEQSKSDIKLTLEVSMVGGFWAQARRNHRVNKELILIKQDVISMILRSTIKGIDV
jgi:hypothetical protein